MDERGVDAALINASISANGHRLASPDVRATALRTHQFRHDNLPSGGFPRVAEDFLVASRFSRWDREASLSIADYFTDPSVLTLGRVDALPVPEGPTIALPEGPRLRMELGEAVVRRRSVRAFTGDPLPLRDLAALVRHAGSVTAEAHQEVGDGGSATIKLRTVPSGGGLFPVGIHLAALSVGGLAGGLYRYDPVADVLVHYAGDEAVSALLDAFVVPAEVIGLDAAAAVLLLVGHPWRSMRKYGPRGLRFVLHEAGGIALQAHLAAAALGLGSVDCASYVDDEAHDVLGLDGVMRALLHTVVLGWPA